MTHPPRFNYSGTPGTRELFGEPPVSSEDMRGVSEDRPTLVNGGAQMNGSGVIGEFPESTELGDPDGSV